MTCRAASRSDAARRRLSPTTIVANTDDPSMQPLTLSAMARCRTLYTYTRKPDGKLFIDAPLLTIKSFDWQRLHHICRTIYCKREGMLN